MVFQKQAHLMIENNLPLRNKTILVTGASSGIGFAIAQKLAQSGASIAIHYNSNLVGAREAYDSIRMAGGNAELFQADLTNYDAYSKLIPSIIEKMGSLDALVNNAGSPQTVKEFLQITPTDWDEILSLVAKAPFFLSQAIFPILMAQGGGHIINISSVGVKYGGSSKTLHYSSAKAALELMTVGLAKMGAPHNILVNTVRPGVIETQYWKDKPKEEYENRVKLIPLGHSGQPNDIAEMVHFLFTPHAAFITGQIFTVSGGE